jgi:CBS domain-containing protein
LVTLDASMDLDEAFRVLEEQDFERVPVVEDGRLVGILSRTIVRRRLAEDEPPPDPEAP